MNTSTQKTCPPRADKFFVIIRVMFKQSTKNVKNPIFIFVFLTVLLGLGLRLSADMSGRTVFGWMWGGEGSGMYSVDTTGGVGWASTSNSDCSNCTGTYSLNVNTDGTLSGYAWSSNFGWIQFNPAGPYPMGVGTTASGAKVVGASLVGWARACSGTVNGDCTGGTRTDGFDGWISLSGKDAGGTKTYGVAAVSDPVSGTKFTGYAWGGDLGWMSFDLKTGATPSPSPAPSPVVSPIAPSPSSSPVTLHDCVGPDGLAMGNGKSKTFYENSLVHAGASCVSQVYVCNNGVVEPPSPLYTKTSCRVLPTGVEQ